MGFFPAPWKDAIGCKTCKDYVGSVNARFDSFEGIFKRISAHKRVNQTLGLRVPLVLAKAQRYL